MNGRRYLFEQAVKHANCEKTPNYDIVSEEQQQESFETAAE
jgi:hypothetical protein